MFWKKSLYEIYNSFIMTYIKRKRKSTDISMAAANLMHFFFRVARNGIWNENEIVEVELCTHVKYIWHLNKKVDGGRATSNTY